MRSWSPEKAHAAVTGEFATWSSMKSAGNPTTKLLDMVAYRDVAQHGFK